MLKITGHESFEDGSWGYVYFSDKTRLAFAPHTSGMSNPLGLFPGGWGAVSHEHYELATAYLIEKGFS